MIILLGFLEGTRTKVWADTVPPSSEALSAILFDARRGQILHKKTSDERNHSPLAGRIMMVLIAIEKADQESLVTASKDAVNTEGGILNLVVGEKYAVKNLVSAVALNGAVDAAVALAEFIGGSEEGFVTMMNEYAAKLGMTNTRYTNATGVFDENQYSTGDDIMLLLKQALSNSSFNSVFSTPAKPWYAISKTVLITNTNNMFWNYESTDGGMAGGNDENFQSIITSATKNSMRLVCLLIDLAPDKMYAESINLLNYGFDNFSYGILVGAKSVQSTYTVEGNQTVNLVPIADVHYIFPKGQTFIKDTDFNIDESKLKLPLLKSTVVGNITFTLMDDFVIQVDLYPDKEILPQKTRRQVLLERLKENMELIYLIGGLLLVELGIITYKVFRFTRRRIIRRQVRHHHHMRQHD